LYDAGRIAQARPDYRDLFTDSADSHRSGEAQALPTAKHIPGDCSDQARICANLRQSADRSMSKPARSVAGTAGFVRRL